MRHRNLRSWHLPLGRGLSLLVLVGSAYLTASNALAHDESGSYAALTALHQWVDAVNSHDYELVEHLIATDFQAPKWPQTKAEFVDYMKRRTFTTLSLRYVMHQSLGETIVFKRIAAIDSYPGFRAEFVISFREIRGEQRIVSAEIIGPTNSELSEVLPQPDLPEQHPTVAVSVSLFDAQTGKPTSARISVVDRKGEYWPPRGHEKYISVGWREDVGGDVIVSNRTYAYVAPWFTVDLIPGQYEIRIEKGMEYVPVTASITITNDKKNDFQFRIKRWINPQAAGWFSGDTHTHFLNDHNALLEAKAESLNVVNVLATKWEQLITNVSNIRGAPSPISEHDHIVYYNEEARHRFLGHTILHPLKEPIYPLSWGGPSEGVPGGLDYPPMAHHADKAHAQGAIVTWAHFPFPYGELAVDVALGKIDSVDLLTWEDPFFLPTSDRGSNPPPSVVGWWYKFLNTGARLPASAGTDKMFNTQVVGSVRTYVYLGKQEFTYDAWANAIGEGKTFVTSGPMLSITADSQGIGSVLARSVGDRVRVEASVRAPHARFPWKRFEIIKNGDVIASIENPNSDDRVTLAISIEVEASFWIASRVYVRMNGDVPALDVTGLNRIPPAAHTSPIYVEVPGSGLWDEGDAAFLAEQCQAAIDWAQNSAVYHTDDQRRSVVDLYRRAKDFYLRSDRLSR